MTPKVFLSHTSELRVNPKGHSFYASAEHAVISLGYSVIAQPYFSPENTPTSDVCAREIGKADYVVFIIGFKWGSPVRDLPEVSYTEHEYNEAVRRNKPRFVFIISDKTPDLTPETVLDRENGERQRYFRERLPEDNQVVMTIKTAEELNHAVYKAIHDWSTHVAPDLSAAANATQPPFDDIGLLLRNGAVIPFLGQDAGLPPDYHPPGTDPPPGRDELIARFAHALSDLELSLFLADYSQYPQGQRLALPNVASFYALTRGPSLVQQRLREAYLGNTAPRAIHRYLASVSTNLLIFVTGFDDLMEQALREAKRPFATIIQPTTGRLADNVIVITHNDPEPHLVLPEEVDIDLETASVVYKPNGSFVRTHNGWDQYVATEDNNIGCARRTGGQFNPEPDV